MKYSSPRDILDKSHLGSIQRKYRRSIDPAAAARDVVSPAHRRGRAGTETGPGGVEIQLFECDQAGLPAACRKEASAPAKRIPCSVSELNGVPGAYSDLGRDGRAP